MFLRQSPLLRLLIPFVAGILAGNLYSCSFEQSALIFLISCMVFFIYHLLAKKITYSYRWLHGGVIFLVFVSIGFTFSVLYNESIYPKHFLNTPSSSFIVRVVSPPLRTSKTLKVEAEAEFLLKDSLWTGCNGKIQLYLQPHDDTLKYGDYIFIHGKPSAIAKPLNPGEFNYAAWLAIHNIYSQMYVEEKKWQRLSFNDASPVYNLSWKLRNFLVTVLKSTVPEEEIYSVASALLVGYEEDIEDSILKSYSSSGTLHVLSVSGMHVALIYKVLEWLLSFLFRYKKGRHIYFSLVLLFIWFYSLLSGLSPSVLRAAMMLSLVIAGKWMSRTSSVYNCMFVSCFLLLAFNPYLLYEVGFQLSLLAVGGIVFVHPLLFRMYTPPGKILYAAWSVISISVCAQLMTFPLGLFYFHQFPNLFLVSNLIIIPATTVAIYASIALVVLYKIPLLGYLSGKLVYVSIWFSNRTAALVDSIPGSVINGVSIAAFEVWMIYILIIIAVLFLLRRQSIYINIFLAGCICYSGLQCAENILISRQSALVVFAVKGKSSILFNQGRNGWMINEEKCFLKDPSVSYHINSFLYNHCIGNINESNIIQNNFLSNEKGNFYLFNDKKILICDSTFRFTANHFEKKIELDLLVISGNAKYKIEYILNYFNVKQVVIDSSVRYSGAMRMKKKFQAAHVNCHYVMQDGAFIF